MEEDEKKEDKGFQDLGTLFQTKIKKQEEENSKPKRKSPALEWQHLALKILSELNIPNFKRGAVFKVCKDNPKEFIERCVTDTKELCTKGEEWKYFFKLTSIKKPNESVNKKQA